MRHLVTSDYEHTKGFRETALGRIVGEKQKTHTHTASGS